MVNFQFSFFLSLWVSVGDFHFSLEYPENFSYHLCTPFNGGDGPKWLSCKFSSIFCLHAIYALWNFWMGMYVGEIGRVLGINKWRWRWVSIRKCHKHYMIGWYESGAGSESRLREHRTTLPPFSPLTYDNDDTLENFVTKSIFMCTFPPFSHVIFPPFHNQATKSTNINNIHHYVPSKSSTLIFPSQIYRVTH